MGYVASGARNLYKCFLTLSIFFVLLTGHAVAQAEYPTVFPLPILVLDQEVLFQESKLGQAVMLIGAEKRTILLQESRAISSAFEAEELSLTEQRAIATAEEFRSLADDFDKRVQAARESQLVKDVDLQKYVDGQNHRFLILAAPYLSKLMQKYQANAILDQRYVLLFDREMDITSEAIQLLDLAFAQNPVMANEKE